MSRIPEGKSVTDYHETMRVKLNRLEGFAEALNERKRAWLMAWVTDARELLKALEQGESK
jgi:hypothetical protein